MKKSINKKFLFLLLFSFLYIGISAQDSEGGGGDGGSGESKRIWEPDLVELWIYWHKTQYRMFSDFAMNEDTLQRYKYQNYMDYMEELAKVDALLFSQYTNNVVPKIPIFIPDVAYMGILFKDITENIDGITDMLSKPPVDAYLIDMFVGSSSEMFLKYTHLLLSTEKVLRGGDSMIGFDYSEGFTSFLGLLISQDNLRDNRFRDDLLNHIIKEMEKIKLSLHTLFVRMRAAKYSLLLDEYLK